MVLGMKKIRTRCKHSVADAVSNYHPCAAEGYETAHSMGVSIDRIEAVQNQGLTSKMS